MVTIINQLEQPHPFENPYNLPERTTTLPITSPTYAKTVWKGGGSRAEMTRTERNDKYGHKDLRSDKSSRSDSAHRARMDLLKKSNKVALSDTSIPGKFKLSSQELNSKLTKRSFSAEDEVNKYGENIYESLKSVDYKYEYQTIQNSQAKKNYRINRSDSDCIITLPKEKLAKNLNQFGSDRRKRNTRSDMKSFTLLGTKERNYIRDRRLSSADDQPWTLLGWSSGYGHKVRSDTDLTIPSRRRNQEQPLSSSYDFANLRELIREKTNAPIPLPRNINKRSNSILRHFSSANRSTNGRRMSVKKRSLSFLKKIWCRKESNKWEPGPIPMHNSCDYMQEMEGPDSDMEVLSDISDSDLHINYKHPRPEPPPDYDNVNISDEEIEVLHRKQMPNLPPRFKKLENKCTSEEAKRPCSPWHDVPKNNRPINSPEPSDRFESNSSWSLEAPELPPKTAACIDNAKDLLSQDTDSGLARLFAEDTPKSEVKRDNSIAVCRKADELTEMLENLKTLNKTPLLLYQNTKDIYEEVKKLKQKESKRRNKEDPDYDIPRPHISLLPSLKQHSITNDSLQATRFFTGHFEDSLDMPTVREGKDEQTMAPDSLECDPWSLNEEIDLIEDQWVYHQRQLPFHPITIDSLFQDSLNPPIVTSVIADYIPRPEYIHNPHNLKIS